MRLRRVVVWFGLPAVVVSAALGGAYWVLWPADPPLPPVPARMAPAGPPPPDFAREVRPVLDHYCVKCHGGAKPKGGLALDAFADEGAAARAVAVWEKVADRLRTREMPPPGRPRPTAGEVAALDRWMLLCAFGVDCVRPPDPGHVTLRRLNRAEYNNTVRDLLGVGLRPADDFPADDAGYGFDNVGDVLATPPSLAEKYLAAAEALVGAAWKDEASRTRNLVKPVDPARFAESAKAILRPFAERAYRRPVGEEELKRLAGVAELARSKGEDPEGALRVALQAVLSSPHFLFHVERNMPGAPQPLSPWELASRASYFLWSSMPDDELFACARDGSLRQPAVLDAQVRRMLRDPRARALAENFAGQRLQTRDLDAAAPDPARFPQFDEPLRAAMKRETELFFEHVVREDRSVLEFLDSDYTFVNERLARHYGIEGVTGPEFRRVRLPDGRRGGVLTQAAVLTVTSNPTRTSPVKRGKWVLENLLGAPTPPPPPGVEPLKEGPQAEAEGSLKERLERHRGDATCASCHRRMDPLGFALENFDAVGAWRDRDGAREVDASGELPDGSAFRGPAELRAVLKERKELFVRCLADKLLTYALGRGTQRADRCAIDQLVQDLTKNDWRIGGLLAGVAHSEPFQMQRR
jgi:hypothetical protein